MKYRIGFLFVLLACQVKAQSFTDNIEVKQFITRPTNLAEFVNLDLTTNVPMDPTKDVDFTLTPRSIQLDTAFPFISVSAAWYETHGKPGNTLLAIRFSMNGTAWDSWQDFVLYDHFEKGRFTETSGQIYVNKKTKYYQLKVRSNLNHEGENIHAILLNFYNPGNELKTCANSLTSNKPRRAVSDTCSCFKPVYISRPEWNCLQIHNPNGTTKITHIILHHSGGTSESEDWTATVLSIWNTSTITYGFKDIGFNWLIAPNGVIYEGRALNGMETPGDHFCDADEGTIGICMLGSFDNQDITPKAKNSLIQLLTWKSCLWNLDPNVLDSLNGLGRPIFQLEGHRAGCVTSCPGDRLQSDLPALRMAVKTNLKQKCLSTSVHSAVEKLHFTCYPNPSNNQLTIKGHSTTHQTIVYQIISIDGQIVKEKNNKVSGDFSLIIDDWNLMHPGIYQLVMRVEEHTYSQNIIKF